ncbi:hypothetical protein DFH27DRAFT_524302 [Peziza echinospora]|nr:hypothetical protein DFH27DRAFT_524302 [Peziza echinospora]
MPLFLTNCAMKILSRRPRTSYPVQVNTQRKWGRMTREVDKFNNNVNNINTINIPVYVSTPSKMPKKSKSSKKASPQRVQNPPASLAAVIMPPAPVFMPPATSLTTAMGEYTALTPDEYTLEVPASPELHPKAPVALMAPVASMMPESSVTTTTYEDTAATRHETTATHWKNTPRAGYTSPGRRLSPLAGIFNVPPGNETIPASWQAKTTWQDGHGYPHQEIPATNIWVRSAVGSPPLGKNNQGILVPRQAVPTWKDWIIELAILYKDPDQFGPESTICYECFDDKGRLIMPKFWHLYKWGDEHQIFVERTDFWANGWTAPGDVENAVASKVEQEHAKEMGQEGIGHEVTGGGGNDDQVIIVHDQLPIRGRFRSASATELSRGTTRTLSIESVKTSASRPPPAPARDEVSDWAAEVEAADTTLASLPTAPLGGNEAPQATAPAERKKETDWASEFEAVVAPQGRTASPQSATPDEEDTSDMYNFGLHFRFPRSRLNNLPTLIYISPINYTQQIVHFELTPHGRGESMFKLGYKANADAPRKTFSDVVESSSILAFQLLNGEPTTLPVEYCEHEPSLATQSDG